MSQLRTRVHFPMTSFGYCFFLALSLLIYNAVADVPLYRDWEAYQNKSLGMLPIQGFHSAPGIKAPIYQVNTLNLEKADPSPFYFLTGAYSGFGYGPSIVSSKDLSLVWVDEHYGMAHSLQPYIFKGQPVLALYMGEEIHIFNQHYQRLYMFSAHSNPTISIFDNHECYITSQDTAIIIYTQFENTDLTSITGPAMGEGVRNCYFQEIDPTTNTVLFEFSTLSHFPVNTTVWPYKKPAPDEKAMAFLDYCHMNSVEKTPKGDYLVGYRHFSSVVLVDGKTSEIKWIMGGKLNQFRDISINRSATFNYQHQPRFSGPNRITFFDNRSLRNDFCPKGDDRCSRGLEIEFDLSAMTMWVVNEYYHPQSISSSSRGGVQRLPNGGTLVAWGQNPLYTEYAPDGEVVMDFQRGSVYSSAHGLKPSIAYRAWKGDWEGKPHWGPNISSHFHHGHHSIYVSWNGATNVNKWILLLSNTTEDLDGPHHIAEELPRMGFETGFDLSENCSFAFARVAALDIHNNIIGSTPAVDIRSRKLIHLDYPIDEVKAIEHPSSSDTAEDDYEFHIPLTYSDIPEFNLESAPIYLAGFIGVSCVIALVSMTHKSNLKRWLLSTNG